MEHRFGRAVELPSTAEEAYRWHERPGAFERLSPPWESVELVEAPVVREGARAHFRLQLGPARSDWIAEVRDVRPGQGFADVQIAGPFSRWQHQHRFLDEDGHARLEDQVAFELPAGPVGDALLSRSVEKRLERMFAYRHAVTVEDLRAHQTLGPDLPLRIAVTGASGLIGSALQPFLTTGGHAVLPVSRARAAEGDSIAWDPARGYVDESRFRGVDAVVHLAGESVFGDRWSDEKKARVKQSRVEGTRLVARTLASLRPRPKVLVCASGTHFYGDTGERVVDERAERGRGFLAEVVQAWEEAAAPARDAGIRVVHLRFAPVLSPKGGALAKMLPLFRAGLGGPFGSGTQWSSFLGINDALDVILRAIADERLEGAVNAVAPESLRQRDFARTLARVLGRPALLPAPAFGLKLALGAQQAEEMLLFSQRVQPRRLVEVGHRFRTPTLEATLRRVLGR